MIRCPKCGTENHDTATNCSKCRVNLKYVIENWEQLQAESRAQAQQTELDQAHQSQVANLMMTTTPLITGRTISNYLGIVSSGVVLGTGVLSELGAGFADLLGTRANGFQNKMKSARDTALHELQEQTFALGGDAVISLEIDYVAIASNMIMVNAYGTAVRFAPE